MTDEEIKNLKPGDWINIEYGYSRKDLYVTRSIAGLVWVCSPEWPAFDSGCLDKTYFNMFPPTYLGPSKKKWYWKFLPFRILICPYKQPQEPSNAHN
jgi:hypothetical protein